MKLVGPADIREWVIESGDLAEFTRSLGRRRDDKRPAYPEALLELPLSLQVLIDELSTEHAEPVSVESLTSIPFYSLCRGLFLPLSGMAPQKAAWLFGLQVEAPPDAAGREALILEFFAKDTGLSLRQKLACVLGDPFQGERGTFRRDSLMTLLASTRMVPRHALVDRLNAVGEAAVLYAESRPQGPGSPALTAVEVLELLRILPRRTRRQRYAILRDVIARCGKLEAYFLAQLLERKAAFGFAYEGPLLARALGEHFGVDPEHVAHAMALTDAFAVAQALDDDGADGLRAIQLQPLVPVRPALAASTTTTIERFPVFVERKYDGIRLMVHKSTDAHGSVLAGAYTRTRRDWLENILGLDSSIKTLPCKSCILDGELYGSVIDIEGPRPATVYEVYAFLQGIRTVPVSLRYAAFDIVYLNGTDLTRLPMSDRRRYLQSLVGPLARHPLPIPLSVSEGQLAQSQEEVNRLYQHFRAQGYEGVIAKDPAGPYLLAQRDPTWVKKKPAVTLDLVLIGAVFAVTTKENTAMFGSYVIAAVTPEGTYQDVGDVAGVDRVKDAEIQQICMREGLLTGRRIERQSASGKRSGVELRPHLVATVRFEGITKDFDTEKLSLRSPKLVHLRTDKSALEADGVARLEELYLRQRVG